MIGTLIALVACGGGGQSVREAQVASSSSLTTEETPFSDSTTTVLENPADLERSLEEIVAESEASFSTGAFEHSCGTFAMIRGDGPPAILKWVEDAWSSASMITPEIELDPDLFVNDSWIEDVTGDGEPEVSISWFYEGGNRTFGQVLSASPDNCEWHYLEVIDGCGINQVFDDLTVVASGPRGTALIDCGYGRAGANFDFQSEFGVFVASPGDGESFCESMREDYDLPLSNCSEGWAVRMAQEEMAANGISVDTDGRYGPGTQMGVLRYQIQNDLPLTGQVDPLTWSLMYPVGSGEDSEWNEYPDYNGDGISSPREIGHASGAFGYFEESAPVETSRRQRPVVVRTYCETRSSGLVSDMRGPLIDYVLVTEYSNGYKTYQTVGSSWSSFSGQCG